MINEKNMTKLLKQEMEKSNGDKSKALDHILKWVSLNDSDKEKIKKMLKTLSDK